jgi:acyl carrier protein
MTIETIRTFIQAEILNDEQFSIENDQDLLLSGTLDSLSVVRLVEYLEAETGVSIPPEDVTLEHFGSLNKIAAYCAGRAA